MIRIVGVHGIRNYEPRAASAAAAAESKAAQWRTALLDSPYFSGSAFDIELEVAYYAHHLIRPGRQGSADLTPDDLAIWASLVADHLPEHPQGALRSSLLAASARLARSVGQHEQLTVVFLERLVREVAAFLRTDGDFAPKPEVLNTVGAAVRGADVVVAHSLGSVVAYETLWRYPAELPLLVTLGSPLAQPMILPRLTPAPVGGFGERPAGVERWINIADPEDFVALPRGGVAARFRGVDEDRFEANTSWNRHGLTEYLQCRSLGEALSKLL